MRRSALKILIKNEYIWSESVCRNGALMKYMGSKRAMLLNGLGTVLENEMPKATRFVDLFSGSASVAWFAATKFDIEVHAFDLQHYSAVLASAVIKRTKAVKADLVWDEWEKKARILVSQIRLPALQPLTQPRIAEWREWCARRPADWVVTRAYGGHYFSPWQSVWIDALRRTTPGSGAIKQLALAALIDAASKCAAAPGHTAQPFQPTRTAKKFLQEAWDRDFRVRTKSALFGISSLCARQKGAATVRDANIAAKSLREGDLVFVDPPYSGVHYSRFYHVLETIARGECGEVSGVGRYPSPKERPKSDYSIGTKSVDALNALLKTLAAQGTKVIFTFPDHVCSNGLSGDLVSDIASKHFKVARKTVKSRFSTLGGNGTGKPNAEGRAARQNAKELILVLSNK